MTDATPGTDRSVPDEQWDVELYNLERDLGQREDVAARYPRIADSLVALMHDAWAEPAPGGAR